MTILRIAARHEVVEVGALERILLQREVEIRAEVINPQSFRPRLLTRRLAIKEQHVGLYSLRVENARRQTQQRVDVSLIQ